MGCGFERIVLLCYVCFSKIPTSFFVDILRLGGEESVVVGRKEGEDDQSTYVCVQ